MGPMSRRSLLKAGAFLVASASPAIRASAAGALSVAGSARVSLRRSTFEPFVGDAFDLGSGGYRRSVVLVEVAGINGAHPGPGEEGRFSLLFRDTSSGAGIPAAIPASIHRFRHNRIGTVDLFASPVDRAQRARHYEVIVNSV